MARKISINELERMISEQIQISENLFSEFEDIAVSHGFSVMHSDVGILQLIVHKAYGDLTMQLGIESDENSMDSMLFEMIILSNSARTYVSLKKMADPTSDQIAKAFDAAETIGMALSGLN